MDFIKDLIKGAIMGIANVIPGVSGGTLAVSMGIYNKLIYSITHLFSQFKKSLKTLLPILLGMLVGIVALSFAIEFLFYEFPVQTSLLFSGLIIGGIPIIYKNIDKRKTGISGILLFILFFSIIIAMQLFNSNGNDIILSTEPIQLIKLFFIGVIASATMVIPGVSGSMLLMSLGYYNSIIETINKTVKSLVAFDIGELINCVIIMIPFGIGVVIGIFAIAKLIEILLAKFKSLTYCAILGLIVASPIVVILQLKAASITIISVLTGIVTFIIGFFIASKLGD